MHNTVTRRDAHPDYIGAKAGERDAATRLATDLLHETAIAEIAYLLDSHVPIIVPIRAVETTGINLIPDAMARELSQRFSLTMTTEIVQTNTVGHTRASGFHRLAFQPLFDGVVEPGKEYVLVDDHVGLGGTLANLRGYIESCGGRVIFATTLSASRNSKMLALKQETLHALREKHGQPLEEEFRCRFDFGLDALTEAEAGYLLRSPSVDGIRDRLVEAGGSGISG